MLIGPWVRSTIQIAMVVLLLDGALAFGQASTFARLVGTVTDQSGALVPGVEVTAVNKETNVTSKTLTNERGDYLIDNLRPGIYDVSAELPGFKKQVFPAVRLEIGQYGRVDFVLTYRRDCRDSDGDGAVSRSSTPRRPRSGR